MALQVRIALTSKGGLAIPEDSIIKFDTIFPQSGLEMHCNLHFYKNLSEAESGNEIFPIEFNGFYGIVKQLSEQDYESLTPLQVHIWLKETLETIPSIGKGNIDII